MNMKLKKLLKQRIASKSFIVIFSIALLILIIGGGFALSSSLNTSEAEKGLPISAEDSETYVVAAADNDVKKSSSVNNVDEIKTANITLNVTNKTSKDEDDSFFIESIGVNEAVCIGKIELKNDSIYKINVSIESGEKIFVALNEFDNIDKCKGVIWRQFTGAIDNHIQAQFTDIQTGIFYVYVGNTGQEPLTNVNGYITIGSKDEVVKNDEKQDELQIIESDTPFFIESIGVNEAVCIGKIELKSDSTYKINASMESGEKIFVALNEFDNIDKYKGVIWNQFTGIIGNQIQAQFTGIQTGAFYVYVGNTGQKPLTNIKGNIIIGGIDETINESEKKDELQLVENDTPFFIKSIGVNEAVCIGKIELKSGSIYTINVEIESGEKIFVALNESDNIDKYKDVIWNQFTGNIGNQIQAQFTDEQTGIFYVYVGNTGQEPLKDVSGILCMEYKE